MKGALPLGNLLILITPFIQGLRRDINLAIAPRKDSELDLKVLHNRLIFQRLKHRHVEQTGHIEQAHFPRGKVTRKNELPTWRADATSIPSTGSPAYAIPSTTYMIPPMQAVKSCRTVCPQRRGSRAKRMTLGSQHRLIPLQLPPSCYLIPKSSIPLPVSLYTTGRWETLAISPSRSSSFAQLRAVGSETSRYSRSPSSLISPKMLYR